MLHTVSRKDSFGRGPKFVFDKKIQSGDIVPAELRYYLHKNSILELLFGVLYMKSNEKGEEISNSESNAHVLTVAVLRCDTIH